MLMPVTIETIASLQAFRKRHADAQRIHSQLSAQPTNIDLTHYRSVLRNKAVVDEAEKILRDFKPVTYDVSTQIKAIETFEAKAVSNALRPISWREGMLICLEEFRWRRRRRRRRRSTRSSRTYRPPSPTSRTHVRSRTLL